MIKRLRVTVDGNTYDVTVELPDEAGVASVPDAVPPTPAHMAPAPVLPPPATTPVAAAGTTVAQAPASQPSGPAGAGDVPSPLSGRVTAVMVAAGQEVKEGDHLITLEAMKMNTFVFAPKSGKVSELLIENGSVVAEGQILVKIN